MIKKLMVGTVAGFLLIGASNVMAGLDAVYTWKYLGAESSSGTVDVPEEVELCVEAIADVRSKGYEYKDSTYLEPRLAALYFENDGDAAVLYCGLVIEF